MVAPGSRPVLARFGPYAILERLGQGGMCHVFRARHDEADYDCALKLLKEERRDDAAVRDLFITEADLALLLDHPNLVRTFDAGEVDGRYYISMELIEGGTLSQLLHQLSQRQVELPIDFTLFILTEILEGLQSLHTATGHTGRELGLIHRDVTPQNIFMSFDGRVILGDFGVALIQAYGDTEPGQVLGKLGYLAPEMVVMEEVDHRADLFAAGVVLFELLTGERLYAGASEEKVMADIADGKVPRPRKLNESIHKGLEAVMLQALARRPRDRFESAEAMVYALEPYWSKKVANPYAVSALLSSIYRDAAREWREQRLSTKTTVDVPHGP